jgi:hypothetical protein
MNWRTSPTQRAVFWRRDTPWRVRAVRLPEPIAEEEPEAMADANANRKLCLLPVTVDREC